MTPGGADTRNETARAEMVARVLERLPLGLAIHDRAAGESLFANAAALAFAKADGKDPTRPCVEAARHVVDLDGRSYDVLTLADATERNRVEDELAKRAFFDDLTGLPGRQI